MGMKRVIVALCFLLFAAKAQTVPKAYATQTIFTSASTSAMQTVELDLSASNQTLMGQNQFYGTSSIATWYGVCAYDPIQKNFFTASGTNLVYSYNTETKENNPSIDFGADSITSLTYSPYTEKLYTLFYLKYYNNYILATSTVSSSSFQNTNINMPISYNYSSSATVNQNQFLWISESPIGELLVMMDLSSQATNAVPLSNCQGEFLFLFADEGNTSFAYAITKTVVSSNQFYYLQEINLKSGVCSSTFFVSATGSEFIIVCNYDAAGSTVYCTKNNRTQGNILASISIKDYSIQSWTFPPVGLNFPFQNIAVSSWPQS